LVRLNSTAAAYSSTEVSFTHPTHGGEFVKMDAAVVWQVDEPWRVEEIELDGQTRG
jgi:hypothetical protein